MDQRPTEWTKGSAPVAVVMISLNEAHNMPEVLDNLAGWAQEIFVLDSFSTDDTVEIARARGVHVAQRRFDGFGSQWNAALELPITSPWTMKLDPDERLSDKLKAELSSAMAAGRSTGLSLHRRLWFMGRPLPITQEITRVWKTGACRFTDVAVNEYPILDGPVTPVDGYMEHLDSPDLGHWLDKQNRYSTSEAEIKFHARPLADKPRLFGTKMQRWMWLKANVDKFPARFTLIFLYYFLLKGLWRAGFVGYVWSRLRADVYRLQYYKFRELQILDANRRKTRD